MSKMLGLFGEALVSMDRSVLSETLNPLTRAVLSAAATAEGMIAVSSLLTTPLQGDRLYKEGDQTLAFCGDLVGLPVIPWSRILSILQEKKYEGLAAYRGRFALAYHDKQNRTITLVSDRRSQQPLYYSWEEGSLVFSTELSAFCRLTRPAEFEINWLFDYLFFNYPLGGTTALKGVFKVPPASVLSFTLATSKTSHYRYASTFRPKQELLAAPQSLDLAARAFQEKIPPYFSGADEIACALTSGWDGRTLLALAPDRDKIVTYTYGVPGCQDLREASRTARKIGIRHEEVYFDDRFVKNLPEQMIETVFLSSGQEKILRSTLSHVYRTLTGSGSRFPLTISGIGMDGIFRGHSQPPAIVSSDMAHVFRSGQVQIREAFWSKVFPDLFPLFRDNIKGKLSDLRRDFGDFQSPGHHLLFKLYVTHPELFGGELKIAENFTTVRVPAWDDDLIDLAFSIKESGLSFSEFSGHKRGDRSEVLLQARILDQVFPAMARIPVGKTRPDIAGKGFLPNEAYRIYRGLVNRIRSLSSTSAPLEDWEKWLNDIHRGFIDDLVFSPRSSIRDYLGEDFLGEIRRSREIHWIGKLCTAEIILRLIKNGWQKSL